MHTHVHTPSELTDLNAGAHAILALTLFSESIVFGNLIGSTGCPQELLKEVSVNKGRRTKGWRPRLHTASQHAVCYFYRPILAMPGFFHKYPFEKKKSFTAKTKVIITRTRESLVFAIPVKYSFLIKKQMRGKNPC